MLSIQSHNACLSCAGSFLNLCRLYFRGVLTFFISVSAIFGASAATNRTDTPQLVAAYTDSLASARTSADSIRILYNLYDLSAQSSLIPVADQLFATAMHAERYDVALDAMLNLANNYSRNDSVLEIVHNKAMLVPESDDRANALTFITMVRNAAKARYAESEVQKMNDLTELLRQTNDNPPVDTRERIIFLHTLCVYLSEVAEGELLADYLTQLGAQIDELPGDTRALKNLYYVWASIIYTHVGQHNLAVEANKNLLNSINQLEERNRQTGRMLRSYDANRYLIYTRMLANYGELTPQEIEEYYKRAMEIASSDPRAAAVYKSAPLPSIYYYYNKEDYRKAFDLIETCLDSPRIEPEKMSILRMYINSAKVLGENDALVKVYPEYIDLLERDIDTRRRERYRELQVIYGVNEIKTELLQVQQEKQTDAKRFWRAITWVCVAALVIMLLLVIWLLRTIRRTKRLAAELSKANKTLVKESESLRKTEEQLRTASETANEANRLKTDFLDIIGHEVKLPLQAIKEQSQILAENIDEEKRRYLGPVADHLIVNCELVSTIINDVFEYSDLRNSVIKIEKTACEADSVCRAAVTAITPKLKPGVTLDLKMPNGNFVFNTDSNRLLQILVNLLGNAAKFTDKGSITLDATADKSGSRAIFTVTDTGIGVPPSYAEKIFDRFTKIDANTSGAGLGLTISRQLATLLGGTLDIDETHTPGARFRLILPL